MKLTAPQMGLLQLVLEDLFTRLEVDFIPAPISSNHALEIGSALGPELACLPLKITLGNLIEGLNAGANTIVMAGGFGPCRFGYYGQIQRLLLERAGYKFGTFIIEPPTGGIGQFVRSFKELAPKKSTWQLYKIIKLNLQKARAIDFLEKKSLQLRAYELEKGSISKAKKRAIKIIKNAFSKEGMDQALDSALKELDKVAIDTEREILKIGLTGEFYLLLEPFANFDIEEYLGHRGVYLERGVYLSDWISPSGQNKVFGIHQKEVIECAQDYLSHFVGGEGQPTIGHTVHFAEHGFDGVIHLFPFTCMPEIIAGSILPKVTKKYDFPLLTLVLDEQSGRAGLITRLEAFIDLLKSRQMRLPRPDKSGLAMTSLRGETRPPRPSLRGSLRPKQSPMEV